MRGVIVLLASSLWLGQVVEGADKPPPSIADISLSSSKASIQERYGPPEHVREQPSSEFWDYNFGSPDENDMGFAWSFNFEQPSGRLISVTRTFDQAAPVETLFPAKQGKTATSPGPASIPVLYRLLDDDRVLLAIGISRSSQPCNQLVLMRRSAVKYFYPWLSSQLSGK
jgi:hypothetical protein